MTTEMTTEMTLETETQTFELLQRQAKLLSTSTLVPKEFQGNMANCCIGLNIAKRLGADPFMVLQNIDIIHGRPSFRATFLIAMVNASGRFSPIKFRMEGDDMKRSCVATATDKETGEMVEGPAVSMEMAKAEGWSTKAGSKWVTMPELMLRYRSAAFFARIYAPDITLGMMTSDEASDIPSEPRQAQGRVVKEGNPFRKKEPEPEEITVKEAKEIQGRNQEEYDQAMEVLNEGIIEMEITKDTFVARAEKGGWIDGDKSLSDLSVDEIDVLSINREAIKKGESK
jgi:hypothetical protein